MWLQLSLIPLNGALLFGKLIHQSFGDQSVVEVLLTPTKLLSPCGYDRMLASRINGQPSRFKYPRCQDLPRKDHAVFCLKSIAETIDPSALSKASATPIETLIHPCFFFGNK